MSVMFIMNPTNCRWMSADSGFTDLTSTVCEKMEEHVVEYEITND